MSSNTTTFILNDETKVNSYGFRVPNKGINLERFKENPVMLYEHVRAQVIGRWENIRFDGSKLLADPVFDLEDEDGKKIAGKVKRNFLKGCSMGLGLFKSFSDSITIAKDGVPELSPVDLMEDSICSVPSNAGAVKLYAPDGNPIEEAQIRLSIGSLITDLNKSQLETMEKIVLSAASLVALGLTVTPENQADLDKAIAELKVQVDTAKQAQLSAESKLKEYKTDSAKAMILQAKLDGKITAEEEAEWVKDAEENPVLTAKLLGKIPGKKSLSASLTKVPNANGSTEKTDANAEEVTLDAFQKMPLQKQLAWKEENPDAYEALFAE